MLKTSLDTTADRRRSQKPEQNRQGSTPTIHRPTTYTMHATIQIGPRGRGNKPKTTRPDQNPRKSTKATGAPGEVRLHLRLVDDHVDNPGHYVKVAQADLHEGHAQLVEHLQRHLQIKMAAAAAAAQDLCEPTSSPPLHGLACPCWTALGHSRTLPHYPSYTVLQGVGVRSYMRLTRFRGKPRERRGQAKNSKK